ncbi:MAG: DUF47 family protein [Sulfuricella sp.]|nr:DUF47 family protein [Sulfuricella sp.]
MAHSLITRLLAAVAPKDEKFFNLFDSHAKVLVEAAKRLAIISSAPISEFELHFAEIRSLETQADSIARTILLSLHKSFITPLDRSEIKDLIMALDDVVDYIEDIPTKSSLYGKGEFTSEMAALGQIVLRAAEKLAEAVNLMHDMTNAVRIIEICGMIGEIESDADRVMRQGMERLFKEENDPKTLIRIKEMYELYEEAVDRCEDAADVIHGITLERI